jgi:multicomponent K+:H+ antiporter subunit G
MTPDPAAAMPWWLQALIALLLLASSALALASALGLARVEPFFRRMHVPALTATLGTWCVTLASILSFSALTGDPHLPVVLIAVLLAVTAPITTALLARATLFRLRSQNNPQVPPPLALREAGLDEH